MGLRERWEVLRQQYNTVDTEMPQRCRKHPGADPTHRRCQVSKIIPLSNSDRVAVVDDEDFEDLSQYTWRLLESGYAARFTRKGGITHSYFMHKVILDLPSGVFGDHINGNKLDNRRANLRQANGFQNAQNARKIERKSSCYKGVSWEKYTQRWRAQIVAYGKWRSLGRHRSEEAAARAYDAAAIELHGDYAVLNFPREGNESPRS